VPISWRGRAWICRSKDSRSGKDRCSRRGRDRRDRRKATAGGRGSSDAGSGTMPSIHPYRAKQEADGRPGAGDPALLEQVEHGGMARRTPRILARNRPRSACRARPRAARIQRNNKMRRALACEPLQNSWKLLRKSYHPVCSGQNIDKFQAFSDTPRRASDCPAAPGNI